MDKAYSNLAKKREMRIVQKWTLNALKDLLIPSAGCYGSTTLIMKGDPEGGGLISTYSKDGHTILSNARFNRALEEAIRRECVEMTRYIVKEVGDGTTSTIILSALIFVNLCEKLGDKYAPYLITSVFKEIADEMKGIIKENGRDITQEDIYKISMICTNNNKEVSNTLQEIYDKHGFDVFIDVAASVTDHDVIKEYNGLTLGVGYCDPCFINTKATKKTDEEAGYSIIKDARVYAFKDPVDTAEMVNYFNTIVSKNVLAPINKYAQSGDKKYLDQVIPTVILAPKISVDVNTSFKSIVEWMYQFNENLDVKPPLLIITNIGVTNEAIYTDIWQLCQCPPIKKYIDHDIQKQDQKAGKAPTKDNICDFYGECEQIKADAYKTTFINPKGMFAYDDAGQIIVDENGPVYSNTYSGQVAFLEQELKVAIDSNESIDVIGNLRRRIHSLKANMVDYFVGGVNVGDRDAVRDLVEDAVKNIRSAAVDGVGYGTNFEGYRAILEVKRRHKENTIDLSNCELKNIIIDTIEEAYNEMSKILYSTVDYSEHDVDIDGLIANSIIEGCPMNFTNKQFDHSVLCTIKQDVAIIDVISKIITLMFTTNQALTQTVGYNMYVAKEDQ